MQEGELRGNAPKQFALGRISTRLSSPQRAAVNSVEEHLEGGGLAPELGAGPSLGKIIERVEERFEGSVGLTAVLRAEAEHHHAATAQRSIHQRAAVLQQGVTQ